MASGGGGNVFDTDAGIAPPACGTKEDGSACDCVDVPLFVDPPTIYFVLDRSGSMEAGNKWLQVRTVVSQIVRSLGPRASFGAAIYPSDTSQCAPGREVMAVRAGDPPSSTADGPTTKAILAATRVVPNGGTPTSASLNAIRPGLQSLPGKKFVILATDGAPNCNPEATCSFRDCQVNIEGIEDCNLIDPKNCCEPPIGVRGNCNDRAATVGAIEALAQGQIPTYVVGLPGTEAYASLLDDMAIAGKTAQTGSPKYFAVGAASEASMLTALKKVAAKITGTCVFDLKEEPNPALVNVYLDDQKLVFEPVHGWTIEGKTIKLLGASCQKVQSGDVLNVRIISGCPRNEPR